MMFHYPHPWTGSFEVPESWLKFSEIKKFKKKIEFYLPPYNVGYELVDLNKIKPPQRNSGVKGLHKCRTVSFLCAIGNEQPLPLISLADCGDHFEVRDGFHRYHCSIIAGLTKIPAIINKMS